MQRRGTVARALVQAHRQAMEALLERIDRQRLPRVCECAGPILDGGMRVGRALEHLEDAALPGAALGFEPLLPVGAVAQVEAFEEGAAPELDGLVELFAGGAGPREMAEL